MRYVKQDPREPDSEPRIGARDDEGCLIMSYDEARLERERIAGRIVERISMVAGIIGWRAKYDPVVLGLTRDYHAADAHCREVAP